MLRAGNPNHVPFFELFVNVDAMEKILGKPIVERTDTVEFYYRAGYDYVPVWARVEMPLGNLIDRSMPYPITDWKSFEEYPWPSTDAISYAEFEQVARILPDGMKATCNSGLSGFFECLQSLVGYEQLCMMLTDAPQLVEAICARLEEIFVGMYRNMAEMEIVGAIDIHDDMGFKTQTLLHPDDLRKYILPVHKRLAEIGHAAR